MAFEHKNFALNHAGRLIVALLMMVMFLLWGMQSLRNRSVALTDAEILVSSLARSLDYQVTGSLRSVEALLDEMADGINPQRWPNATIQDRFRTRLRGLPEIRNLVILGPDGTVLDASLAQPDAPMPYSTDTLADRDYFITLKRDFPARKLVVGIPVVGAFSGQPSLPVARAIIGKDGSFAGAVVAALTPDIFRDQIQSVLIEPQGAGALIRSDGIFLARLPMHEEFLGRSVAQSPLFQDHLSRTGIGIAHYTAVADGNNKIVAFRRNDRYATVVIIGITRSTALARWRTQTTTEGGVLLILGIALFLVARLYDLRATANRQLTRQLAENRDDLERQIEERTAHLAASNAELERFAYVASHDLQEPLRSISSFLQLLERRYGDSLDQDAHEYISFAVNAAKRMSVLINDLLTLSRVGRQDAPPERCDTESLAKAAATALTQSIDDQHARILIGPMPPVLCQPSHLQSLFQNLLGNAIKYHDDSRPPVITISARPYAEAPSMIEISVADNGIGIDPQYYDRIFGIFQRLHPIGRYPGTGIGLALCRKIVERHGGRIWVESIPGQGSTFHFTLRATSH